MPQVDLETLVCGGGEQKIACETQIDGDSTPEQPEYPPDFPAESFYVSKEDELEWFDRNAVYERKESTKGNSMDSNSTTKSNSQRFSMNLKSKKSSIIGLPKAPQNSTYTSCKFRHNKPSNARFFPKRTRSKSSVQETTEPSSPKVSCIGRVRSRRQRLRQLSRNKSTTVPSDVKTTVGFWGNLKVVLCLRCRGSQAVNVVEGSTESPATPNQKSEKRKSPSPSHSTELAPGMNELKRFASGRRYDSLGGGGGNNFDLEIDESDSADCARRETGPYVRR